MYIKDDLEEQDKVWGTVYPFLLIFPNKKRLYYIPTLEEKLQWIKHLTEALGTKLVTTFYELGHAMGKGKYGVVSKGRHLRTNVSVAIKQVKKSELSL